MNEIFWALLLVMLLVAVVIVIYPLLRVRGSTAIAYKDSNLGLYEDKIAELEADLGEGRIDHEQYQQARQEIDRELLYDVPTESKGTASLHHTSRVKRQPALAVMVSVFLPMLSLLVYMELGMYTSTKPQFAEAMANAQAKMKAQQAQTERHRKTDKTGSIENATQELAERLKQQGGSAAEWTMLGRAYKHLGQYLRSAEAYDQAMKQQSPTAQLMIEYSEALALTNNQRFTPEARALVMRALKLEPNDVNVLWFAGVAEFQEGNYRESLEHLSRLSEYARQDPKMSRSLRIYIDKARNALVTAGEAVPSTGEIPSTAMASGDAANGGASFQVSIDVNEDVRSRFSAGDAVFVYAKATAGPKMPLAVQRLTLGQLPTTVMLADSMTMMEGMNMSSVGSVVVSARVTTTGSAIAKAGDYIGEFEVDDVSATEQVNIRIDTPVQ